ncbi:MAG: hypothetical protein J7I99_05490 [Methanophagales archaeon]|nr:hypothetical protein [Methanophagales archaeon]
MPDRITRLMERFFETVKEKEGLIVVKPGKIRVLKVAQFKKYLLELRLAPLNHLSERQEN